MAVHVCVRDDGTVFPVKHHRPWDLKSGSKERDSLVVDLMRWSDLVSTYSDLLTDECVSLVRGPLSIIVTYTASLAAFGAIIEHGFRTADAVKGYFETKSIESERKLSRELFKLAKRVTDFVYQLMKLHVFGELVDLQLVKIVKSIATSTEDVWDVIEADRKVAVIEDLQLRKLRKQENNFLFADAMVKIAFHALAVMAIFSSTLVSTPTMLLLGGASIVVTLVTKTVTRERVMEESRQAAEKVNRWIQAGKRLEEAV